MAGLSGLYHKLTRGGWHCVSVGRRGMGRTSQHACLSRQTTRSRCIIVLAWLQSHRRMLPMGVTCRETWRIPWLRPRRLARRLSQIQIQLLPPVSLAANSLEYHISFCICDFRRPGYLNARTLCCDHCFHHSADDPLISIQPYVLRI